MNRPAAAPTWATWIAKAVVTCAAVGLSVQAAAQVRVRMGSSAMLPTLAEGEQLEVNVAAYAESSPARWDIVTFKVPNGNYVLNYRIIGLPGDTVSYDSKKLLRINSEAVTLTHTDLNVLTEYEEDEVFIESWHSERHLVKVRRGGPVLMQEAIEPFVDRHMCSYTRESFSCVVPPGKYFVMGDNRDSSRDSRYRGFIPLENILGRVESALALPARR